MKTVTFTFEIINLGVTFGILKEVDGYCRVHNRIYEQLLLGEYLEQYGLEEGYLLVFDFRKESNRLEGIEESRVEVNGKKKRIIEAFC